MAPVKANREGLSLEAARSGAIVSVLVIPGETATATTLDFWSLLLTTFTTSLSTFGVLELCGIESRMRCRCRVRMAICSERRPSCKNIEGFSGSGSVVGEKLVTAAA